MEVYEILKTMVVLFSIILLGYFVNKIKILDKTTNMKLSQLVLKVTTPALILSSVASGGESLVDKGEIISIFFIGIGMYLFLILFAWGVVKLLKYNDENSVIYQMMIIFPNYGFIGYPILGSLYGNSVIFPYSILHIPFNLLLFSYGVYLIKKGDGGNKFKFKDVLNPGVIASLIAMFIFLLDIKLPDLFVQTCSLVGDSTIPLSMLLIGSSLALIPIKSIFNESKIYVITCIKLIIFPIIIFYIAKIFLNDELIISFIILSVALPTASSVGMLTTQYGLSEKIGSVGVFITTILSIITLPFIIALLLV